MFLTMQGRLVGYQLPIEFINLATSFFHGSTALVGLGLLIVEVSRSHSDTPHKVVLLWTRYRPVAETST